MASNRNHNRSFAPPARHFAWASAVYAVATLSLAWPALLGRFLAGPHSDQYIAGYAFREFAGSMLRAGEGFPQWNPFLFGGMPFVAAMHGDIFYPTFLLRMILPTDVAMTWGFVIHFFLAGLFTFGFLRAWGVGFFGALLGGLAYMMSGPIAAYVSPGHDGKLFVSTLLPAVLWLLVLGIRDGRPWVWGALSIVFGLGVLSPHPQLFQYLLLAAGSFALFTALSTHPGQGKLPGPVITRRLGYALGAVVVGMLMGAIQYLPVTEYVHWSPRSGGKGWEAATSFSMPPEELLNAFVPQFSGIMDRYWGRNFIHFHSEYAGIVVLLLAGAGMGWAGRQRTTESGQRRTENGTGFGAFRWFWIGTFIVSLLWTLGGFTPFYRIVYELVPGTKFFRAPSTMMYVPMFALAVLAALGTERVLTAIESVRPRFLLLWSGAVLLLVVAFVAGLPVAIAEAVWASYDPNAVADRIGRAHDNQGRVILGAFRSLVFFGLAAAAIWGLARNALSRQSAAWGLVALVALDAWTIQRMYWFFSPPAREIFAADPGIEAMQNGPMGRVIPLGIEAGEGRDPFLSGDALMSHRIRSERGYHGNELGRYQMLTEHARLPLDLDVRLAPGYWRHLNVRYLYTSANPELIGSWAQQLGSGDFQLLAGPMRNAFGSMVYLYRVPGDNPPAWLARGFITAPDDVARGVVLDPRFDPRTVAIVDTGSAIQAPPREALPPPLETTATVTQFAPGRIDVTIDGEAPTGSALVVSENYYPGWRAAVDGAPATLVRANFNLMAVELPAGARSVELRFADPLYQRGRVITLVALLLAVGLTVAGVVAGRRAAAFTPVENRAAQ